MIPGANDSPIVRSQFSPSLLVRRQLSADLGYVTPKVGADAAIFDEQGRILLVQRADDALWCLPCGWLEPGESPDEAAVRETREETGLEVRVVQLVDLFSRKAGVDGAVHSLVAAIYLCERIGGTLQTSHESLAVRYWDIDDVPAWHSIQERYARAARGVWDTLTRPPKGRYLL
jgi:ADP-ribose pyrophosphatase YjhB (NUDIX family)